MPRLEGAIGLRACLFVMGLVALSGGRVCYSLVSHCDAFGKIGKLMGSLHAIITNLYALRGILFPFSVCRQPCVYECMLQDDLYMVGSGRDLSCPPSNAGPSHFIALRLLM